MAEKFREFYIGGFEKLNCPFCGHSYVRGFTLEEEKLEYLKGTTTVGLTCEDGVVLATDTRATAGYEIASKRAQKLYKVTDNIAATVAGGVGDTQSLIRTLRAEARIFHRREGTPIRVRAAAKLTSNIFQSARMFPYLAVLILAGVDDSGPGLYLLSLDGSLIEESKVATGSGSPVAYGLLESEYREDFEIDEALALAVRALSSAIERDIATGNEIRAAKITEEGYEELSPQKVKKIIN